MPVHPHQVSMLVVTELRREELLDQVRQEQMAQRAGEHHGVDVPLHSSVSRSPLTSALRAEGSRFARQLATRVELSQPAPGEPT